MLDVAQLPAHYVGKYGIERVAQVIGKSSSLVSMWHKRGKFSLDAVAKLLEFDPEPLAAIKPLYTNPAPGTKLAILMPLSSPAEPKSNDALLKLYDKREMDYRRMSFNSLPVLRNALAAAALRDGFEWMYWRDGDMVEPCGDAEWFKAAAERPEMPDAYAGIQTIYRLLFHKKSMVSVSYVSRQKNAVPQFGGDAAANRLEMRRGPQNRLIERPWAGFGGILTHRSVFEDIIRTQGDEIRMKADGAMRKRFNYDYAFFHPIDCEMPGEDLPFAVRAGRAGHKCYVDLAVQAAHIGDRSYTYADVT